MKRLPWHMLLCALVAVCGCGGPPPRTTATTPDATGPGWALAQALLGAWVDSTSRDSFLMVEAWERVDDSTLAGIGHVLAGRDTVFVEHLRLERRGGSLVYAALPGGQRNGTWTRFTAVPTGGDTLLFSDPRHDFPQHIRYVRDDAGWHATIAGTVQGAPLAEQFRFRPR